MENVESRFLHLLQPIRDLTKNWEVDVAAQLGEYLEELDQICISFDGGQTTMNFIEAALLIQGSACIYSKKVEYLYSLVYQALDFISNKKRDKQPTSMGEDGTDTDVSAGPRTEEEEFLSLDDIKDTNVVSLDMKKDHQPNTVNIVPLTPMALVPPEETEKKDNPLFSRKGEILASRKDFRMNTCTPHASGAFMLELAGLSPTQCFQARRQAGDLGSATGGQTAAPGSGNAPMEVSACETPVPVLNFSENEGAVAPDGGGGGDDDDAGGGGGDFLPDAPEGGVETSPAAVEHIHQQKSVPEGKGYMLRERAPAVEPSVHIKEMLDPWRSLDPFDNSEDKPFKKGISYGDQLVASCGRLGEWHSFASLVAGKPAFEVCRSMLASLQLANDCTVEISQQAGLEEAVDTMRLRLLTQERAHERFRTYLAPSVSN
ncbi:condensin-2 complex subunit H2-like [Mauremys mutica]|uniref:condensin-2 complex subunit H2-like n=1 Tax=Mauremys mutica TaxID=74926 RepID=UPI001D14E12D|nr:condensin-2 complex subunit H2-like [Mauremys mutica]XP_044856490.1 condensin-2 complex subunit H2-like [Mauremys mutica]XP_044857301.1 condensin-2 complex subunit H2-like [Mauremys mutica]